MAADIHWNNVVLAMHMDGPNGSTTIVDQKSSALTATGGGVISTADSKFGGAALHYAAYTSSPTVTPTLEKYKISGDFTIEFFIKLPVFYAGSTFFTRADNFLGFRQRSNGLTWLFNGNLRHVDGCMTANTWHHLAMARSGNLVRVFIDGVMVDSATISGTTTTGAYQIGGVAGFDGGFCWIDELRITADVARYTSNFAPPTVAFPDSGIEKLSGTILDHNGLPLARTVKSFRRSDCLLVDSVVSNLSTGSFELNPADGSEHFVIVFDDDKNALIYDHVTPA